MGKFMKILGVSLLIILLSSAIAIFVVMNVTGEQRDSDSIEELVKYAYETSEVTTDLKDGSFVRIQFKILTDGKKAHEEISQRDFQINNILIKELSVMEEDDFTNNLSELEKTLKNKLNEIMKEGKVIDVYTINKILQ